MKAEDLSSYRLDHLGLPATMAEEIGMVEILDEMAGTDSRETISFGQAVLAMTLNCLGFTSKPLYLSPTFFKRRDVKFLLGCSRTRDDLDIEASHLNQHKLGRALDTIADLGPDRVFLTVAIQAFRRQGVKVPQLQCDTTSHSFSGQYVDADGEPRKGLLGDEDPTEIIITHGYSKDHRSDLKQVVQELLVSSDGDVPLMLKVHSGNANDSIIMRERIAQLKSSLVAARAEDLMPKVLVADSKFYAEATLKLAKNEGTAWISKVPETVKLRAETLVAALDSRLPWTRSDLGKGMKYITSDVEWSGIKQRYFLIQTEASRNRAKKTIERRIKKEGDELTKKLKALSKMAFFCEEDLRNAYEKTLASAPHHISMEFEILRDDGDTPNDHGTPLGSLKFRLGSHTHLVNKSATSRAEQLQSCFVIATNAMDQEASDIIRAYLHDQQGVERSFRFLKDNRYFADAFFLKNPGRIAALMCVMTLALLLHALLQRSLRLKLKAANQTLPNQLGKGTERPTLRWVNECFEGIDIIRAQTESGICHIF